MYHSSAPYFVDDYIKTTQAQLLLPLLGFNFSEEQWSFPTDLDIVTIEHLDRAKLFAKRNMPEPKRRVKNAPNAIADETEEAVKPKPISRMKEDSLNIKSAQVNSKLDFSLWLIHPTMKTTKSFLPGKRLLEKKEI